MAVAVLVLTLGVSSVDAQTTEPDQDAVAADVRCVVVAFRMGGSTDPQTRYRGATMAILTTDAAEAN